MYSSSPTPIVLVPKLRGPPTNPIQPVATHASDSKEPPYPIVIIRLPQVAGLLMVSAETIIALQAESSNSRRIVLPVITRVLTHCSGLTVACDFCVTFSSWVLRWRTILRWDVG